MRRFKERVNNPLKRWKLSYEDFRHRERWADYEVGIEDMMELTSTKWTPWYLVPANDKLLERLATFKILNCFVGPRRTHFPGVSTPGRSSLLFPNGTR
jgi:polyphosphate kinase 2 (PPK2 family)